MKAKTMKLKTSNFKFPILLLAALAALAAFAGCSDDDDPVTPMSDSESFTLTIENVSMGGDYAVSGVFNTPVGAMGPGAAGPGAAYEFTFGANPGDKLSFATMFVQSNDLFFAPSGDGIALFTGDVPVTGDVTSQVSLWDAGTEMNETPGEGDNQAPRQSGGNTGAVDSDTTVRMVNDAFTYPDVADVIEVTISHLGDHLFRARLENVSTESTLMITGGSVAVPLAPGTFVVHTTADPLFSAGMADQLGLEGLAEDGDPSALIASLEAHTSLAVPLAPGVAVVHTSAAMIYTAGAVNGGLGLEALAEDGDPSAYVLALGSTAGVSDAIVFNTPVGAMGPAPIFPGESYSVTFTAEPGDRLSLATMFVQSNDLFYAFNEAGLALFDGNDNQVLGNVTASLGLYDAGTERNQWPGAGPDQAPRQSGADTGPADSDNTVRMVADDFMYPMTSSVIRVTLSAGN